MGWASWNNYRVNINEHIIRAQADKLVKLGLDDVGYTYLNIDDGFFGGRDADGNLIAHPGKFPEGMKALADYIHSNGLKAGIYTDAGVNTCASYWDHDTLGVGVGLYGHETRDLELMLGNWGYDFIKVDWCGGEWLGLNEQIRYIQIGNIIRAINPKVVYNVCRWKFPGEWVVTAADSWRVSGDIANTFKSVMSIVDQNAELWRYSGPGHVNDMDMLQVGRGMSFEEDKSHFTMWCMMNSPLMAGNDLTKVSNETLSILMNKDMIAVNQDPLVYQARRIHDYGDLEVWAKPMISTISGQVVVALLNRSQEEQYIGVDISTIGIDPSHGYTMKDLWSKKKFPSSTAREIGSKVPSHGVVVFKIEGKNLPYNIFQKLPLKD
jgi:hypothetical protein